MMANIGLQARNLQLCLKNINLTSFINIGSIKLYSVFPPTYIKPIFRKEDQALLEETGEAENLAHVPIKPAFGDDTCSEFHDPIVRKFTNIIMRKGKKVLARSLIEQTFETIKRIQIERYHKETPEARREIILDPTTILHKALINVEPVMELMGIKKGGTTYQVPVPLKEPRRKFLAMNWLVQMCKEKDPRTPYAVVLAKELIDASNNRGRVVKKKQDLHRQCEANRSFAHYRWT
ncbi:28S ribosomal protein S7, mitochondrial [Microplitis demolitor]|uniref:28S ribosomal protein S7, mitochondrial n=1 Tax=Microplitis demolitor TaxID=69319 RepID=UPI0004CD3FC9|nr:28S ribosomal protein S7, mitochondrial [Microplitis demolitor]